MNKELIVIDTNIFLSALKTEDYIAQKSKDVNRENFLSVLNKVPSIEPDEFDK